MKKSFLFASIVALAAAGAVQANTAIGRVAAIDRANHTVRLRDGGTYTFKGSDAATWLGGFMPGDSVRIEWAPSGQVRQGEAISSTSTFQEIGVIETIDPAARTVKLAGGHAFTFEDSDYAREHLGSFKAGDHVRVAFDIGQGRLVGRAIGDTASDQVSGVIEKTDIGMRTVTLADGKTFSLDPSIDAAAALEGLLAGDRVSMIVIPDGSGKTVESISPVAN